MRPRFKRTLINLNKLSLFRLKSRFGAAFIIFGCLHSNLVWEIYLNAKVNRAFRARKWSQRPASVGLSMTARHMISLAAVHSLFYQKDFRLLKVFSKQFLAAFWPASGRFLAISWWPHPLSRFEANRLLADRRSAQDQIVVEFKPEPHVWPKKATVLRTFRLSRSIPVQCSLIRQSTSLEGINGRTTGPNTAVSRYTFNLFRAFITFPFECASVS